MSYVFDHFNFLTRSVDPVKKAARNEKRRRTQETEDESFQSLVEDMTTLSLEVPTSAVKALCFIASLHSRKIFMLAESIKHDPK